MADERPIELLYDRQCPVCDFYGRHVDVRAGDGRLVRLDAREPGALLDEVTARGIDVDEGLVLRVDDELYVGADAMQKLAELGSASGPFNRIVRFVFRSRTAARLLYPVLRAGRNLLLKLLGRTRINNLDVDGNDRF